MPAKKPKTIHPFRCSNKFCNKTFKSLKGLNSHLAQSSLCKTDFRPIPRNQSNDAARPLVDTDTVMQPVEFSQPLGDDDMVEEEQDLLEEEAQPSSLHMSMPHTTAQYYEVKLLQILDAANAQHFLFNQVMSWAREAFENNYNFRPAHKKRGHYITALANNLNLNHQRPERIPVTLPGDNKEIALVRFQFRHMLESLLSDPDLVGDLKNLDVNEDDPFGPYRSPHNVLSCVNSGKWYRHAHAHLCKTKNDFLCPIIMASDETKLSQGGKPQHGPCTSHCPSLTRRCATSHSHGVPLAISMI